MAALAAVMLTSRVQIGVPTLGGFNATFETITAAVVGGTSLFGGRGTVVGVIIGAIIIRTINNCIVLLNIPSQLYQAVMGAHHRHRPRGRRRAQPLPRRADMTGVGG